MANNNNYDSSSIKVLEGLEAVRKRPGMYIGSTDSRGLHHLVWEIFDNSIDEVLAGYASHIWVTLHTNGYISVQDDGRGIPVDINKDTKLSGVEMAFTILHAGGKFDGTVYKSSGGLHGVGSAVVNALSDDVYVTVTRDKKMHQVHFGNGGKILKKLAPYDGKVVVKNGTLVTFHPDKLIFPDINFDSEVIASRLKEASFLFAGLEITFVDEIKNKTETFLAKKGLLDFIQYINQGKNTITSPINLSGKYADIEVKIAMQYSSESSETIFSFANAVKTFEGGSHETGLKQGLTSVINDYARKQGLLKEKDKNLEGDDVREGLSAIISIGVPERLINYEGQTKNKLFTPEASDAVKKVISTEFATWLDTHKTEAVAIVKQAIEARKFRLETRTKKETNKKSKLSKLDKFMSGKLTPAQSKDPVYNELFLVEGDSAGGSAKLGRNKMYQAILPLKGKVINAQKSTLKDLLNNEEITTIINCLGCGINKNMNINDLKYHKVIIMTDADVDGSHIQTLLLTLFFNLMRPLIEKGHIYIALPPLYKISAKNNPAKYEYAWDETQLEELKTQFSSYEIQRYKGLGEMNADQLWDTTMNPERRHLIQVGIEDFLNANNKVDVLMGNDPSLRKDWIDQNIDFEMEE